jgi:hypothetical protein
LIQESGLEIDQFIADLEVDRRTIAEETLTEEGRTLWVILNRLCAAIEAQDVLAYRLIDCIAFLERRPWIHRAFVRKYAEVSHRESISETRYAIALRVLQQYSLIDLDENSHLAVHPFVQELLRSRVVMEIPRVSMRAGIVAEHYLEWLTIDHYGGWKHFPREWVEELYCSVVHIADILGELAAVMGCGGLASVVAKEFLRSGAFDILAYCFTSRRYRPALSRHAPSLWNHDWLRTDRETVRYSAHWREYYGVGENDTSREYVGSLIHSLVRNLVNKVADAEAEGRLVFDGRSFEDKNQFEIDDLDAVYQRMSLRNGAWLFAESEGCFYPALT